MSSSSSTPSPSSTTAPEDNDTLFILICFLGVMVMQAGFALIEVGAVSNASIKPILFKNIMDMHLSVIFSFLFGYYFAHGDWLFTMAQDYSDPSELANKYAQVLFHASFAAACVTIVSGCVAERIKIGAYLGYALLFSGFVYPLIVSFVWSDKGILSPANAARIVPCGAEDFAGSMVVHGVGGTAGIVAIYHLGPRVRVADGTLVHHINDNGPVYQSVGCLFLTFGWFFFNGGSALEISGDSARIVAHAMFTTACAAPTAAIFALLLDSFIIASKGHHQKPPLRLGTCINGLLSGLVSITSGCAVMSMTGALVTGALGGISFVVGREYLRSFETKIDIMAPRGHFDKIKKQQQLDREQPMRLLKKAWVKPSGKPVPEMLYVCRHNINAGESCKKCNPSANGCNGEDPDNDGPIPHVPAAENHDAEDHSDPELTELQTANAPMFDDVVDAIPVHGLCGIQGTILTGIFAHPQHYDSTHGPQSSAQMCAGVVYGGNGSLLAANAVLVIITVVIVFSCSWLLFWGLKEMNWLREDEDTERGDGEIEFDPPPVVQQIWGMVAFDADFQRWKVNKGAERAEEKLANMRRDKTKNSLRWRTIRNALLREEGKANDLVNEAKDYLGKSVRVNFQASSEETIVETERKRFKIKIEHLEKFYGTVIDVKDDGTKNLFSVQLKGAYYDFFRKGASKLKDVPVVVYLQTGQIEKVCDHCSQPVNICSRENKDNVLECQCTFPACRNLVDKGVIQKNDCITYQLENYRKDGEKFCEEFCKPCSSADRTGGAEEENETSNNAEAKGKAEMMKNTFMEALEGNFKKQLEDWANKLDEHVTAHGVWSDQIRLFKDEMPVFTSTHPDGFTTEKNSRTVAGTTNTPMTDMQNLDKQISELKERISELEQWRTGGQGNGDADAEEQSGDKFYDAGEGSSEAKSPAT